MAMDRASPPASAAAAPTQTRWRRLLLRLGLRGQLILAFSLLLMLALSTTFYLLLENSRNALSDILGEQARQIAQTLAMAAQRPCAAGDAAELQSLGRTLLRSRNIVLVAFCDASGKPLAVLSRDAGFDLARWLATAADTTSPSELMRVHERSLPGVGDFLQVTAPVVEATGPGGGTRLVGYLTVGVAQDSERAQMRQATVVGVGMGFAVFMVCLPLAGMLIHRIFQPIRHLVSASNRIAAGDYGARVATHRPDEIGMLARSFNEMILKVQQHQHALRLANERLAEANRDLEGRVQLRTAELESANKRLSSEIAEKEDFLRAVSHDLNAPLRNIGGMAGMLLVKHRDRLDADAVHRLERIQGNVQAGSDLIAELLELSRIKTRRQKIEPVDLDALVRDLRGVFEEDLERHGIELSVEGALPAMQCERLRMRQVFQNLIDNAIKYMGEGPVRRIRVGCRMTGDGAEFFVADTGIGIDAEDAGRVFRVFRRGKSSHEVNVPGKGVGLASVKSIIEMYDGRLWLESEVGKGSTFRFLIPRRHLSPEAPLRGAA